MPLSAGERLGPYKIMGLIGAGGMGEVYRAHDTRLRRDVAIKISAQQFTEPFPTADNELRISTAGGEQPRWRRDGKELFYLAADGKLIAVAVTVSAANKPSLKAGVPAVPFDAHSAVQNQVFFNYDVTGDGKRFLVSTIAGAASSSASSTPPLTVRINWNAASKN